MRNIDKRIIEEGFHTGYEVDFVTIQQSDYEYLKEQAERVQELEEELYGNNIQMGYKQMYSECNRDYAKLRRQNKRYRKVINNIIEKVMLFGTNKEVYEAIQDAIKALEGEE